MRVTPKELQNGAYIKCTMTKAFNDDSEMCQSIFPSGHVLGLIGLRENYCKGSKIVSVIISTIGLA